MLHQSLAWSEDKVEKFITYHFNLENIAWKANRYKNTHPSLGWLLQP